MPRLPAPLAEPMVRAKPRVYFDADALIAGAYSPSGGAGFLLLAAEATLIVPIISPQVVEEVRRNLAKKLPSALPAFTQLLRAVPFKLAKRPTPSERTAHLHLADAKDAAHVAAAHQTKATYIVTFNVRHYRAELIWDAFGIGVLTPGDLIAELRALKHI